MKFSCIAVAVFALVLSSTGWVSAQKPGTVDTEAGKSDPTEEDFLEQQKEAPDETTEEAWMKEEDAKTATEVDLRPGTEGAAAQPSPGTREFERERERGDMARTGVSRQARDRDPDEKMIPLKFAFHGYYRARYNWIQNNPLPKVTNFETGESNYPTRDAQYGYMRLRLDPEVTYGPNPDLPIARLRFTIDGFDNVVFGDNARVFGVPLFATDQSATNVDGFDLRETLRLERAWIEFLVPIGQVRVGRMESQWGTGLLTHAGNGLAEWGDFLRGETFDRILFATRPITIARAISKGDSRQTPLIYAFVYDRLSQDQVVDPVINRPPPNTIPAPYPTYEFLPFLTYFDNRNLFPNEYLTHLDTRVNEIVNVFAWFDEDFGRAPSDELFAGVYFVYRWQINTNSKIYIPDVAWRLQQTLKNKRRLAIFTEGEYYWIGGKSGALAFTGSPEGGNCVSTPCREGRGNIHNVLAKIGVKSEGEWAFQLEGGYSSGDDDNLSLVERGEPGTPTLKARGFNTNVKVGLLMYQVALKALSFNAFFPQGAVELGANGSVWNSKYFMPSYRVTIVNGLEFHTQALFGWAAALDPFVYGGVDAVESCGFKSECWLGWELDLALRARIGADDIVWVDMEGGFMQPGKAFTNAGFSDAWLWTIQLRAAMVF